VREIGPITGGLVEILYEEKENIRILFCILINHTPISHIPVGKGMEFILWGN
jgi:hypothetical protein